VSTQKPCEAQEKEQCPGRCDDEEKEVFGVQGDKQGKG
jgi:hypothetical protein